MFEQLTLQSTIQSVNVQTVILTLLIAFVLSALIVVTYDYTTRGVQKSAHFLQSLALISVVASTVMQAIGDSVGLGLGMIGVFSIIRFRTSLSNPRNMTFMFASLAVGIACGVYGFIIAIVGTVGFCLLAILIHFTPLGQTNELVGTLKVQIPKEVSYRKQLIFVLDEYCSGYDLDQYRFLNPRKVRELDANGDKTTQYINRDHLQELTYLIKLKPKFEAYELSNTLIDMEGFEEVRIKFSKETTRM